MMTGSQRFAGNYALWMFLRSPDSLRNHGNARQGTVQLEQEILCQETAIPSVAPLDSAPEVCIK